MGYSIRHTRRDDLGRVARMLDAADLADYGHATYTEADLEDEWSRPRFDLGRDCWVVESPDGSIAGYAYVWVREEQEHLIEIGVVHPQHRGRGVGSMLLDALHARSREHAAGATGVTVSNVVPAGDDAVRSLLTSRGYSFQRQFWRMEKELSTADDVAVSDPPGAAIRPVDPGPHDEIIHALIHDTFREHWRFRFEPIEEWRERRLARGRPAWLVARAGNEIVGALVGRVEDTVGRVEQLGVLASWRRRGVGEALLRRAFAGFARMGATDAELEVDSENETGATALYERVGMRSTMAYAFFDRTI